jgi:hypothetical protein
MNELQWDDGVTAGNIMRNDLGILKNFMHQYPGAGIFFLVDDVPPGQALVQVRSFNSGTFFSHNSFNTMMFSFFKKP